MYQSNVGRERIGSGDVGFRLGYGFNSHRAEAIVKPK